MLENTAKVHVSNILKKFNAANRTMTLLSPTGYSVTTPSRVTHLASGQSITLKALIPPL